MTINVNIGSLLTANVSNYANAAQTLISFAIPAQTVNVSSVNNTTNLQTAIVNVAVGTANSQINFQAPANISVVPNNTTNIYSISVQPIGGVKTTFNIPYGIYTFVFGGATVFYVLLPSRSYNWQPGLSYTPTSGWGAPTLPPAGWVAAGGGIQTTLGTQQGSTYNPVGGSSDDTVNIQNLLNAAGANASQATPKYVKLGLGKFNISNGGGLFIQNAYVSLVGSGAGPGMGANLNTAAYINTYSTSATMLVKANGSFSPVVTIGWGFGEGATTWIPAANSLSTGDMVVGTNNCILANPGNLTINVGQIVYVNELWDPNLSWINTLAGQGSGYYGIGEGGNSTSQTLARVIGQAMEVATWNVANGYIAFTTNFAQTYRANHSAHLANTAPGNRTNWSGLSNMFLCGGAGGDGSGQIYMGSAMYCWIKGVEISGHGNFNNYAGSLVHFATNFRCELRDSYLHGDLIDIPLIQPGGSYYNIVIDSFNSDTLVENCISWIGNKVMVMRDSGPGNVIGYNLMDDGYGNYYASENETGLNQNHMVGSHHTLFEGNYSWQLASESRWGNTNFATFFRNWASTMRLSAWPTILIPLSSSCAANNPLIGFTYNAGSNNTSFYEDAWLRRAVYASSFSFDYNFIGNVLGYPGNPLLTSPQSTGDYNSGPQTGWLYETYGPFVGFVGNNIIPIWVVGGTDNQAGGGADGHGSVQVTASIAAQILTITSYPGGSNTLVYPGLFVTGSGVAANTYVTGFIGAANGAAGQYTVNQSQTVGSTTMLIGYYNNGQTNDLDQVVLPVTIRDGNFDFFTGNTHWHGNGGAGTGQITPPGASASGGSILPNSLYMTSKPGWMGAFPWPWVNGTSNTNPLPGGTNGLPALARFNQGNPNGILSSATRPGYNTGTGLFVLNGKIYDSNGVPFRPRGVNLAQPLGVTSQPGLSNANMNIVRFAVRYNDASAVVYANYIQSSMVNYNMVAVPSFFQDASGNNTSGSTADTGNGSINNAVTWWTTNYSTLASHQKHMILNITNEWNGANVADWAAQNNTAVQTLRTAGYTCPIMIDIYALGTDVTDLGTYASTIFNNDPQKNIIFACHEYSTAPSFIANNYATTLANLGTTVGCASALMAFGPASTDGTANPQLLINACEAAGIGWCAWAWEDPVSTYDMTVGASGAFSGNVYTASTSSQLTAYGQVVVPYYNFALKGTDFP